MRVMIIDDEIPAIDEITYFLEGYPIKEIKSFQNPILALAEVESFKPNLIFVDIEMPQLKGIDFAVKLREINEKCSLIFVTAYTEYALEAYKVRPTDYILKPIDEKYFNKKMEYVIGIWKGIEKELKPQKIECFGKFRVLDMENEEIKFATKKTKELFAYFIAKIDSVIYRDELIMELFPITDPEKALNNFYVTLYRLRKALEISGLSREDIVITENGISKISEGVCPYVDLNRILNKGPVDKDIEKIRSFLNENKGSLFADIDFHWADDARYYFEAKIKREASRIL